MKSQRFPYITPPDADAFISEPLSPVAVATHPRCAGTPLLYATPETVVQ